MAYVPAVGYGDKSAKIISQFASLADNVSFCLFMQKIKTKNPIPFLAKDLD
jgi:hypothetical protein